MRDEGEGLLTAFNALLVSVDPERRDRVLRHGIKLLLENGYRRIGSRKDPDAGATIRTRLRGALWRDNSPPRLVAVETRPQRIGS